jgi:hypothetical protein
MPTSERNDAKGGPLGNFSQVYFGGLDSVAKGYEPALKSLGRWNLEVVGLMTRRSQAWLEVPVRLGRCRTPVDVFNEQMRFWQSAVADYSDGWRRLTAAWGACAVMSRLNGAQPRDYMTFGDPQESSMPGKRGERKAA